MLDEVGGEMVVIVLPLPCILGPELSTCLRQRVLEQPHLDAPSAAAHVQVTLGTYGAALAGAARGTQTP